jgi:general secretion pathway protein J
MNSSNNKCTRQAMVSFSHGFTLVELLLAITLMSILLGLTYTGLRAATRSAERGEAMLAAGGEVRSAHQFVRRQVNLMLPLPFAVAGETDDERVVFEGDANHIQYVGPMPGYLGSGGPQVQLLEFASHDYGNVLQFSHSLLQGFEQSLLFERDPVTLLRDVDSAGFEFLGRDENGEITEWAPYWEEQDTLPVAVRLSVEFSENTQLNWPELIASVRVDEQAVAGGAGRQTYEQTIRDLIRGKGQVKKQ